MKVRPATRHDLPGILEIYNDAVLKTTASYDYEPRTLEHRTMWYEERMKEGYPVLVAENGNGQVVGWSALNPFHARMGYRFTAENSVYVAADERGKGIGKLLLGPLVDAAKTRGCMRSLLQSMRRMKPASGCMHTSGSSQWRI